MKKMLSFLLVVTMLLCMICACGDDKENDKDDKRPSETVVEEGMLGNVKWAYYEDDTLVISGKGSIPSYDTNADFPWSGFAEDAVEIIIEEGVTSIGARAFYDFQEVRTVTLPESLESIGADAFCNCYSVTRVNYDGSDSDWANVSVMSGNSAIAPENNQGNPDYTESDNGWDSSYWYEESAESKPETVAPVL